MSASSLLDTGLTILAFLGCFAAGAFLWTFIEYALHNWRGHKGKGKNEFSREHLKHHAETDYFTPTPKKVVAASKGLMVLAPIALLALGWFYGATFTIGFLVGYIGYEVIHRRLHTHAPRGFYGRWARKHHFTHHFTRPNDNHGVTQPIWDLVFGTYVQPERVRVPRKHAMDWLVDENGEVRERYRRDYELTGRKRSRV